MRHLVKAGVPSQNLHGIDIVNFWDLGFEMFNDRERFGAKFTQADMMASDGALAELEGKFDVISIFQVRVARQVEQNPTGASPVSMTPPSP